jgi:c-di-AMP phosphodiesterase-like protein
MELGEKVYYFYVYPEEGVIYFLDVTTESSLKKKIERNQLVLGAISVDNYDDVTENMSEKDISIMNSYVTSIITDWFKERQVFIKRINSEKFYFVGNFDQLSDMMKGNFDLLDQFRKKMSEKNARLTLSIGVGYGMGDAENINVVSNNNLEIALVRGGDQAVVKSERETEKPRYFGGKTASVVKRTRVRTRAMSTALKSIIQDAEDVYIMGHRTPDMDAIGSAFGLAYFTRNLSKKARVILDKTQFIPDVERTYQELKQYPELFNSIISPEEVMKEKKDNSLLILVDHNNPHLTISEKVYLSFDKVVVIDHHRRSDDFPSNPLLSYIESSASSASEIVTELIQYQNSRKNRLSKSEATLLLAGIVVDTRSFQARTTSRTYDSASYLKTFGADNAKVQNILASDLTSYLEMNELISSSEYVTEDIIVAYGQSNRIYGSVTTAKAADTILSMSGVNASFVISKRNDGKIGISARSKGSINVQLIMEELGGGGHFNNAAVQLPNQPIESVKDKLIATIQENINELYDKE